MAAPLPALFSSFAPARVSQLNVLTHPFKSSSLISSSSSSLFAGSFRLQPLLTSSSLHAAPTPAAHRKFSTTRATAQDEALQAKVSSRVYFDISIGNPVGKLLEEELSDCLVMRRERIWLQRFSFPSHYQGFHDSGWRF